MGLAEIVGAHAVVTEELRNAKGIHAKVGQIGTDAVRAALSGFHLERLWDRNRVAVSAPEFLSLEIIRRQNGARSDLGCFYLGKK